MHLGLFEALRSPQSAEAVATRLGLAPDLVTAWARALQAQGWLQLRDGLYRVTPTLAWLLDAPEGAALHALLDYAVETLVPRLTRLPELMKGAEHPPPATPDDAHRIALISRLVEPRALRALGRVPGARRAKQVLDVGCGQGSYLTAFLRHYRDAQGVGVERDPGVAQEAVRALREADVERRSEIRVGDFMTLELPMRRFDLILLNHNLYYFPRAEHGALFRRLGEHLAEHGTVAIQTPVLTEGPLASLLGLAAATAVFDLVLRLHGDMYGLPDLEGLRSTLREAGFEDIGEVPVLPTGAVRYVWARLSPGS
jgi:SAM-dependent methyltransferase